MSWQGNFVVSTGRTHDIELKGSSNIPDVANQLDLANSSPASLPRGRTNSAFVLANVRCTAEAEAEQGRSRIPIK